MLAAWLIYTSSIIQLTSQIRFEEEECTSRHGWRGSCKASWECLPLGELVAGGYQPELCTSDRPIICCPQTNMLGSLSSNLFPWAQPSPDFPYGPSEVVFPNQNPAAWERPRLNRPGPQTKRKRYPNGFVKTVIQDEDDNLIVKVAPLRNPLSRKKRKPLIRASQKSSLGADTPQDQVVQDDQMLFSFSKPHSISLTKCEEYGSFAWDHTPTTHNVLPYISHEFCPSSPKASRVELAEFPFMVGLGYEDSEGQIFWGCSGTLISKEYVLTAAHCLHPPLGRPKVLKLGTTTLASRGDGGIETGLTEVLLHPLYNPSDRSADIALLRLAPLPSLGIKIRPACIQANATGPIFTPHWINKPSVTIRMKTEYDELKLKPDNEVLRLRKAQTVELPLSHCNISDQNGGFLCVDTMSTASCQSASEGGEPLIQRDKFNPCIHKVVGVAVDKACTPFQSTIFTDIQPYISWIERIVWE